MFFNNDISKVILFALFVGTLSSIVTCSSNSECVYDKIQCSSFAAQCMVADSLDWGEPIDYDYENHIFTFYYETPEMEAALLGTRAVEVDCRSGEASIVPRD